MSTLSIRGLKPAQIKALGKQARFRGKTASEYVRDLIEKELVLADQTFDQILRPIRDGFAENGVSEDEFDRLVTQARRTIHRKRSGRRK